MKAEENRSVPIFHRYADVNGVRLHYASAGSPTAPLMLFVHGFPQFWHAWHALLPEFGRTHHAVAPDTRGINLSSKPEGVKAYHAKELTEDLRQLVKHLGHDKCVLVAHDWGGAVAWNFAVQHPELVDKLVIVNAPHPVMFARELKHNPKQRAASDYMRLLRMDKAERVLADDNFRRLSGFFREWGHAGGSKADAATVALHQQAWAQPGALTAGLNYYRASPLYPPGPGEPDHIPELRAQDFTVRVPTLVIWGDSDTALLPGLLEGLDEVVPDLRVEHIAQGSHWVVHEFPDKIIELIRNFTGPPP